MTSRLYYTTASGGPEPIEELSVVKLVRGIEVDLVGQLPAGSLGAIVFVHNEGEVYEVEFAEPFAAVVTLSRDDVEPTETTRETPPTSGIYGGVRSVWIDRRDQRTAELCTAYKF